MTFTKQQLDWLIAGMESVIADTQHMIDLPPSFHDDPNSWQEDKDKMVTLKERLKKERKGGK